MYAPFLKKESPSLTIFFQPLKNLVIIKNGKIQNDLPTTKPRNPRNQRFRDTISQAMDLFGPLPDMYMHFNNLDEPCSTMLPKGLNDSTDRPPCFSYCKERGGDMDLLIPYAVPSPQREQAVLADIVKFSQKTPLECKVSSRSTVSLPMVSYISFLLASTGRYFH